MLGIHDPVCHDIAISGLTGNREDLPMRRRFRPLAVAGAMILTLASLGPATADAPTREVPHAINVGDANGFVAVAETTTPEGAVIDTFQSGDMTVKVIGTPGASISFYPGASAEDNTKTLGVLMTTVRPKTEKDATRYRDSGRTVVGDLVALGVPRDVAEREFGDMETMDGTNPYLTDVDATSTAVLASVVGPSQETRAPDAATTATPYDTQCITASAAGGLIYGYGCSTFYRVSAVGTDWWFNNKYKFSAHSSDTSFPFPKRLQQVGWKIQWSSDNVVYDWEPFSTMPRGSCATVTLSATWKGIGISIAGTICPDKLEPWELASTKSGARWVGAEAGTAWEAAIGLQAVHNPPGVATSYSSYAMWVYWPG